MHQRRFRGKLAIWLNSKMEISVLGM